MTTRSTDKQGAAVPRRQSTRASSPARPGPIADWRRWLPLVVMASAAVLVYAVGWHHYLSFESLKEHREALMGAVERDFLVASAAYVALYALSVSLSLPGATMLTISGGFLFGTAFGTLYAVCGATLGAVVVFLVARSTLGDALRRRAGPRWRQMEVGFRANALSYMLVLRLVPLFPFFLVNLAPAFLGVPVASYVIGTFAGIIPGTFVYASVGTGLGSMLDAMEPFATGAMLTPEVIGALTGLALLALLPVAYRRYHARLRPKRSSSDSQGAGEER